MSDGCGWSQLRSDHSRIGPEGSDGSGFILHELECSDFKEAFKFLREVSHEVVKTKLSWRFPLKRLKL